MSNNLKTGLLASTIFAGAMIIGSPAMAQVTDPVEATSPDVSADGQPVEEDKDIVITGSRIARPDLEVASPVAVINEDEIQLRQANDAEQLLRDLPQVRPNLGPGVNNGSTGAANVDLRGIGANRTLPLLDGRRIVPFDLNGVPDLNVIPVGLVERVDVVTGGASTVYGADAVAGVINFITRRSFSGLEVSGNYRITEDGDGAQYRADLLIGANLDDRRGNVVMGVGYFNRNELRQDSRTYGVTVLSSVNGLPQGSQTAVPLIFLAPNFGAATSPLGAVLDLNTGTLRGALQTDLYNTNPDNFYQTPLERYSFYTAGRYEVTDGVEVYANALFSRNIANIQSAPSGTFGNTFRVPLNNPFLPVGVRNQLCAAAAITPVDCTAAAAVQGGAANPAYREVAGIPSRRFVEYGPRLGPVATNTFQTVIGMRGDITSTLRYDLSAQYGESRQNQLRENWGSASKVQQALRAFRNSAGQLVCQDTANGCVPINLFGPAGSISQEQLAFIDLDAIIARTVQQTVVTGSINGDFFGITSPFATNPFGFALGAEYRKIRAEARPDAPSQIQSEVLGTGARTPPDVGQYDVREYFGEIAIPIIEDGFIKNLTLEAGIRFSDYSTTGKSTTWKAGGFMEPVDGVRFRGMYQRAVRSPNIQELFQSPVQGLGNLTVDPCGGAAPTAPRSLCEATGAPAGTYGTIPQPNSGQINVTSSGNPNLDVERASTWTLGVVFAPRRMIPGLSLTVDWFRIEIEDLIAAVGQNDVLQGCYSTTLNPTQTANDFCGLIRRNPLNGSLNGAGDTLGVVTASGNFGRLSTSGVDIGFSYRRGFDWAGFNGEPGDITLGFNATWLDYYRVQSTPNSVHRDCTAFYSTSCTNPRPEWKWNARLGWSDGPTDVSFLWNHISAVDLEPIRPDGTPLNTPAPGNTAAAFNPILSQFRQIDSFDYFDLAVRFEVSEHFTFTLLVENLFDKTPPILGSGVGGTAFNNGNTFPTTYDVLGRTFTAGARLRF